jgi:hypothetical protein
LPLSPTTTIEKFHATTSRSDFAPRAVRVHATPLLVER